MRSHEGANHSYLCLASRGCAGKWIRDCQLVNSGIRFDDIPKREGDLFAAAHVPSVRERNTILAPLVGVRTARDCRRERIGRARQHYEIRGLDVNLRGNVLDGEHAESQGTKRGCDFRFLQVRRRVCIRSHLDAAVINSFVAD